MQREAEFAALVAAGLVARGVRIVVELVERVAGAACAPDDERCDHGEAVGRYRLFGCRKW